jgi:hypothetical protein
MKMRTSVNKQALKSLEGNILTHYRRHECEMFIMMAIHGIIYIKSLETKSWKRSRIIPIIKARHVLLLTA